MKFKASPLLPWGAILGILIVPSPVHAGSDPIELGGRVVIAPDEDEHQDGLHLTVAQGEITDRFIRANMGSQSGRVIGGVSVQMASSFIVNDTHPHMRIAPGGRIELDATEQFIENDLSIGPSLLVAEREFSMNTLAFIQPLTGRTDRASGERFYCGGAGVRIESQYKRLSLAGDIERSQCVERVGFAMDPTYGRWTSAELKGGIILGENKSPIRLGVYAGFEKRELDRSQGMDSQERIFSVSISTNRDSNRSAKAW